MPITEIPNSGNVYRVHQLDKEQASQQNEYNRRQKKKKIIDEKAKKQEESQEKGAGPKDGRINLVV